MLSSTLSAKHIFDLTKTNNNGTQLWLYPNNMSESIMDGL